MRETVGRAGWLSAALIAIGACGGNVETTPLGSGGSGGGSSTTTSTSSSSSASSASSASSTSSTSASSTGGPEDCAAIASAIAKVMNGGEACTAVVRLDYVSRKILGFEVMCAPYAAIDEAAARAVAQADTGQGQSGQSIAGALPEEEWVFWQDALDFGGAAAVSRRTGTSVFGGTVVWSGKGDITYPKAWQAPSAIGEGCGTPDPNLKRRGFDLGTGKPLADTDVQAALAVAQGTAVPAALWQGGYLFDAMVLLYPRTVGALDPAAAEWIVLLNSGWLE